MGQTYRFTATESKKTSGKLILDSSSFPISQQPGILNQLVSFLLFLIGGIPLILYVLHCFGVPVGDWEYPGRHHRYNPYRRVRVNLPERNEYGRIDIRDRERRKSHGTACGTCESRSGRGQQSQIPRQQGGSGNNRGGVFWWPGILLLANYPKFVEWT